MCDRNNRPYRMDEEDDTNMDMEDTEEYDEDFIDDEDIDDEDDDDVDDEEDDLDGMNDDGTGFGSSSASGGGGPIVGATTTNGSGNGGTTTATTTTTDRSSASQQQQQQAPPPPEPVEEDSAIARRRAIQAIMADKSLTEQEKRFRIQELMSQNRLHVAPPPTPALPSSSSLGPNSIGTETSAACVHYERNCNIVAPCCNRIFGCRICHDELSPGHPPMNRFLIREVVCKNCSIRQAATNQCVNCQTIFGEYHCNICNLWMSQVCVVINTKFYSFYGK